MIVKDKFRLVSGTENVINVSASVIKQYSEEENSPRHVFAILELKKKSISHFTTNTIFKWVSNKAKRESINIIKVDDYPLPVTYNIPTKGNIINLKPFSVDEVSSMSVNDLYASLVYAYAFQKLVTKKYKIKEEYAKIIVKYLLSFYVQIFGKEYGLVGIYASGIPKLKFLIACYIYSAFFGVKSNRELMQKASSIAPYLYTNEFDQLKKYDFYHIEQFIQAVSDLKVMPGLTVTKFTSKLYRFFGINILPAIEDCSRFFSVILTSSILGSRLVPKYLFKYNQTEYFQLIEIVRRKF